MNKTLKIINFCLLLVLCVFDILYMIYGELYLKGLASSIFVIVGIVNLVYAIKKKMDLKFPIILTTGLTVAMIADIILNIHFIAGAVLFAIGHIFYFVAYMFLCKFSLKDLMFAGLIFVPSLLFIVLAPIFTFNGIVMELVCCFYCLIISIMVGKAISNFVRDKNLTNLIILIGSCLFFISDLMLLLDNFASISNVFGYICLSTYYPAQFLLGFSIMIYNEKNKKTDDKKIDSNEKKIEE